jgi:putative Mg2+ transporter-C (MgtC) family protein
VEIEAVLSASSVDGEHLDGLIARLAALDCITQAFWRPSTTE